MVAKKQLCHRSAETPVTRSAWQRYGLPWSPLLHAFSGNSHPVSRLQNRRVNSPRRQFPAEHQQLSLAELQGVGIGGVIVSAPYADFKSCACGALGCGS